MLFHVVGKGFENAVKRLGPLDVGLVSARTLEIDLNDHWILHTSPCSPGSPCCQSIGH